MRKQFWNKQSSRKQKQQIESGRQRPVSPLQVTELREHIFSYLDPIDIRRSILPVCREWFWIYRRLFEKETLWEIDPAGPLPKDVIKNIHCTGRLYWYYTANHSKAIHAHYEKDTAQWDKLVLVLRKNHVRCLQTRKRFQNIFHSSKNTVDNEIRAAIFDRPLQHLDFIASQNLDSLLPSILPSLSFLTTLRLRSRVFGHVPFDMILRACPLLEKFQAGMLGVILELSGPFVPANKKCPGEMCLPLQSFELENVTLEYSSLSSLLDVCPSLKDLRLVNVMFMEQASTVSPSGTESNSNMLYNQQMFNPKDHVTRLLEHLKQLQMQLNTFHVSVYAARALDPKLFEMLEVCPQATEWTFWTEGMTESLFKNLSLIPNTLTSLELLWDTCAGSRWSSGLHKYLCQSPHLLHLKAPQTLLLVKHLDVNGRLSAPTTYWGARVIAYPGIWRCRRLKTLHINFDWTNHFHGSAPAPARLVFGYLARVCPYLEDLQLCGKRRDQYENKLWLGLDGGLCLLAGMTRLERLHVGTGCNHFHFEAWELSWITPLGLNLDHRRARQARMAGWAGDILKEEREDVKNTQMETTPTEELIGSELVTMKPAEDEAELKEKLKNLGKLIDVKLMLEQIDSGCFVCWPNLQRIILYDDIEVGRRPSAEMKRLFSKD